MMMCGPLAQLQAKVDRFREVIVFIRDCPRVELPLDV